MRCSGRPWLQHCDILCQQNELHMDTHMHGFLGFIAGACGVVAAVSYGALCRRPSLRSLLMLCLTAGTIANLGYLLYSSWERALLIDGLNGFGYTLTELALMDPCGARHNGRHRGPRICPDGQYPELCAFWYRLVRLAAAGQLSYFV